MRYAAIAATEAIATSTATPTAAPIAEPTAAEPLSEDDVELAGWGATAAALDGAGEGDTTATLAGSTARNVRFPAGRPLTEVSTCSDFDMPELLTARLGSSKDVAAAAADEANDAASVTLILADAELRRRSG